MADDVAGNGNYPGSGGGGGGGGPVTIADPTTSSNQAAVEAPGTTGAFALAVQSPGPTAVPFPVSGTFWPATQPVSGTFWQATQPISAASLPLPAGASTAAKQAALGTAGTPSADVYTVQGAPSMTAVKVDGSGVTQPVSGTFWQSTQPVSISGSVAVTGTFWQSTQPVSIATAPALVASNAKIGNVGGATAQVVVTPTITSGSAYAAGNTIGGLLTFSSALLTAGSGILESIFVRMKSAQTCTLNLTLFLANPSNTTWTNKATPSYNTADNANLVGTYQLTTALSPFGGMTIYNLNAIAQALNAGATTLYGVLTILAGTPTFGSTSDVSVGIVLLQD